MKIQTQNIMQTVTRAACFMLILLVPVIGFAQEDEPADAEDETEAVAVKPKVKPVKNTFESVWIIDNQTVMVPAKKTLEMDIMHRFGTLDKGYDDFFGLFAPSNIRLGFSYSPIDRLNIGIGLTKTNFVYDASVKYAIFQQTKEQMPVSVTYYGNLSLDKNNPDIHRYTTDRFLFFNQLIVARKINDKLSLQIAPSVSHQNYVYGYYKQVDSATRVVAGEMQHNHWAVAFSGRYKLSNVTAFLFNYDQPLTSAKGLEWLFGNHVTSNPNPNLSFGLEFSTGSHAFQLFAGNYFYLNPARNNLFNKNNYEDRKFLIGFNVTRLWSY